jgi:hypothetical protein
MDPPWVFGDCRRIRDLVLRGDEPCPNWHPQMGRFVRDDCRITINGRPVCPLSGSVLTLTEPRMIAWFNVHSMRTSASRITIGRGVTLGPGAFAYFIEVLDVDMSSSDLAELPGIRHAGLFTACVKLRECTLSSELRAIGPYSFH